MQRILSIITKLGLLLFVGVVHAGAPSLMTFQSKIILPSGTALESASVNFRFTTLDSAGTCVLYVEDFSTVNMTGSQGVVAIPLGSGVKVYPPTATNLYDVFNNSTASYNCQAGGTFSPTGTDNRQVVMQFNDGGGWQTIPQMAINAVPYSNYATRSENLGDYAASAYLRPTTLPTCTGSQALSWNGTTFACVSASGGAMSGVTSIANASGDITLAPVTTTGKVLITSNAPSTGSSTGALVVQGGVGVSGDINTSGNMLSSGSVSVSGTISSASSVYAPQIYGTTTPSGSIRIDGTSNAAKGNVLLSSAGGNVGIGTTTPSYKVDVVGDVNISGVFRVNGTPISTGSGTVTNVSSANSDIGVATGSSTPVLTLNSGTGASQIVKLTAASKYPAVDGSLITNLNLGSVGTSTLAVANGGTGQSSYVNGELLIGNTTGNTLTKSTLTAGTGISIANGSGSITISRSGSSDLTSAVTGILPIANGGTNSSTALTNNKVMVSSGGAIIEGMASNTAKSNNTFVMRDGSGNIAGALGTFDQLSVINGGTIGLNGSASGTISVVAPAAPTSYTFTLPTTAGSPNYVLSTNGSGVTSWVAPSSGVALSALTAATGTNTIDNLNFAQIWNWSTATTQIPLSISANALTTGSLIQATTSNGSVNSTNGLLYVGNTGASTSGTVARVQSNSTAGSGLTVLANGNVGIGTTTPGSALDIPGGLSVISAASNVNSVLAQGSATLNGPMLSPTGTDANSNLVLKGKGSGGVIALGSSVSWPSNSSPGSNLLVYGPNNSMSSNGGAFQVWSSDSMAQDKGGSIGLGGNDGVSIGRNFASIDGFKENATSGNYDGYLAFGTRANGSNTSEKFRITSTGNVGIGTTTPSYKLDVAGDVNISGVYRVNGTPISTGSGTVTGVSSSNSDIGVATGSSTPVLTLNSGTGNNQIVKLTAAAKYPAVDGSLITNLNLGSVGTTTLAVANGGTGQASYTNGELLIGNTTGNTLTKSTLTAGSGISITNGTGSITIATTAAASTDLTTGVSGVLAVANGGTNSNATLTNNKVMVSSGGAIVEGMASNTAKSNNTFVMRDGSGNIAGALGTYDQLSVINGGAIGLNGSASGTISVVAPAAPTSYTFTLPTSAGSPSYVLSTNGSGVTSWVAQPSGAAFSALSAASAANGIDNTNYAQSWDWSTATTQNPLTLRANGLTTGSLLTLTTSSGSLNSTSGVLNVANTGASTNGMVARIQSNSTAGSGMTVLANGNVGIGTTTPAASLEIVGGAKITVGGLNLNSTGISNAGSILGVGTNITGSSAVTLSAGGVAQNISLLASTSGVVKIGTGNGTQLSVIDNGAAITDYVTVKGSITAKSPTISVDGSDTWSNLILTPKGIQSTILVLAPGAAEPVSATTASINSYLTVLGPAYSLSTGNGTLAVASNDSQAVDKGGSIEFDGNIGGYVFPNQTFGLIGGYKENSTSGDKAGYLAFGTHISGGGVSERLRITSTGNVGIGTMAPSNKLTITDGVTTAVTSLTGASPLIAVEGNGGTYTMVRDNAAGIEYMDGVSSGNYAFSGAVSAHAYSLRTGNTDRLYITSAGNVGIGTTLPQTTLQVAGVISPATNNTYTLGNATYRFTEVYATNGVINTSDRREKKDIYNTDLGLDFINKLRPVSYRWNTGVDNDVHYGLIAQEAEQAIAEVGKTEKTSIVTHDEATDRYGVRYSELISPLIKAVQQLYNRILGIDREIVSVKAEKADKNEVDAKVQKLESENEKLKQENAAIKAYLCSKDKKASIFLVFTA